MTNQLLAILQSLGYPVYMRSYLLDIADIPQTFITYEETSTDDAYIFDNLTSAITWDYTVTLIGKNPEKLVSIAKEIKKKLQQTPFTLKVLGNADRADDTDYVIRNLYIKGIERI